jgi:hypothetical protein
MVYGRLTLLRKGRGSAHRRDEVDVSLTANPSWRDDDLVSRLSEVCDLIQRLLCLGVELAYDRSERHAQYEVVSVAATFACTLAMRATFGFEMMLIPVVYERRELRIGTYDDATAVSTVAAVWAALGNKRLATKRHASGTAVTATYVYV